MSKRKIFITGASGCIGHYVLDALLKEPDTSLYLLTRDSKRFLFNTTQYPQITLVEGNMETIESHENLLKEMDGVIHIATYWGGLEPGRLINLEKTKVLLDALNPDKCRKIIYFSTESILGKNDMPSPEAGEFGTGYVKSKYEAYQMIQQHPLFERINILYPTLVMGGDETHPFSHISSGILPNIKYLKIIRFFDFNAHLHMAHGKDIATVTAHLLNHDHPGASYILGGPVLTARMVVDALCKAFHIKPRPVLTITSKRVLFLAKLFRIKLDAWDRYCIENPHFNHHVTSPASFGLVPAFPTLDHIVQDIKMQHDKGVLPQSPRYPH
ncbi:MAG: NAD(P)-dependent oxidoreductase [Candidatus Margulisbacteria bacterium]|nr:NAD(P)-dependent oxidoreductase [Candidatus Margulisiibacteriota bacterium]